jgi:hypothetical protein
VITIEANMYLHMFFYHLFISALLNIKTGVGGFVIPLTGLTTPHFVPVRDQDLDFICWGILCTVFGGLRWEVIVHFVDIWGMVGVQCLNFLFITVWIKYKDTCTFQHSDLYPHSKGQPAKYNKFYSSGSRFITNSVNC